MPHDVEILKAAPNDVPELMAICAEHAAFERLPHVAGIRADLFAEALLGSAPRLHAWLARVEGELVGYASATLDFSTLDRRPYLHMDCLFIREAWRSQAIGQRLWNCVHAQAALLGCAAIQWQTPSWNERAAHFYRRLGARESAKLRYVLPLRDD